MFIRNFFYFFIYKVDQELAAKIDSEISLESDFNDSNEMPESLKEFIDSGLFKVCPSAFILLDHFISLNAQLWNPKSQSDI